MLNILQKIVIVSRILFVLRNHKGLELLESYLGVLVGVHVSHECVGELLELGALHTLIDYLGHHRMQLLLTY